MDIIFCKCRFYFLWMCIIDLLKIFVLIVLSLFLSFDFELMCHFLYLVNNCILLLVPYRFSPEGTIAFLCVRQSVCLFVRPSICLSVRLSLPLHFCAHCCTTMTKPRVDSVQWIHSIIYCCQVESINVTWWQYHCNSSMPMKLPFYMMKCKSLAYGYIGYWYLHYRRSLVLSYSHLRTPMEYPPFGLTNAVF